MGQFDWLLSKIDNPGNWGRWIPGAAAQNEGGVDLSEPHGTPIYALGTGPLQGWGTFNHADGSPGYGVLTEQVNVPGLGKANVYYQHIDLLPIFKACKNGQCGGQIVKRGQLIGYTRQNMYGLEVGINPGWGGIWSGSTAPGAWVTDPRPFLKALAKQGDGTGTDTAGKAPQTTTPTTPTDPDANTATSSQCTPPSNPLDVGGGISYAWCQATGTLVSYGQHIAVFLIALILIIAGIYLLAHKQINSFVIQSAKTAAKAPKTAAKAAEVAAV